MQQLKNYINGELRGPESGEYIDNYNPSRGKVYSKIPRSGRADVDQAVKAAEAAFEGWAGMTVEKRADILLRLSGLISKNLDRLAEAESIDNGKPVWLSRSVDIPRAVDNFKFFATGVIHFASESHSMGNEGFNYTLREPIGVVGCISPWNLPLYLFTWKIAPALAAGNCVIAKPSEITPMTAYLLSELCIEAGLPKGVLNIIHGYGPEAGEAIIAHPGIKALSFTGGTKTGAHIATVAGPMFKKLSLELGGKNPNIIFADCDFDEMLKVTLRSSFANQGQICLCGSRIYIEESLYPRFRDAFVEKVKSMKIGDPLLEESRQGAVVSRPHFEKVLSYIELARQEGGKVLCGGEAVNPGGECAEGWFIAPTVIEGLPHQCRTNMEEIFGPVVTLTPFKTEEEVLAYANATEYGLAATIWTSDLKRAHRVAAKVKSGIIWVNCWLVRDLRTPFGGMKSSGVGREGGWEALRFFTEPKNVCIQL